jgi:hypothetical protein
MTLRGRSPLTTAPFSPNSNDGRSRKGGTRIIFNGRCGDATRTFHWGPDVRGISAVDIQTESRALKLSISTLRKFPVDRKTSKKTRQRLFPRPMIPNAISRSCPKIDPNARPRRRLHYAFGEAREQSAMTTTAFLTFARSTSFLRMMIVVV